MIRKERRGRKEGEKMGGKEKWSHVVIIYPLRLSVTSVSFSDGSYLKTIDYSGLKWLQ